jgi:RNA polymerase sigma factor (sigma-70 family)
MKTILSLATDAGLVRRALGDRPEAFEELVLRHQRKAHAVARSLGVHAASADDVVQESFLRAFQDLAALRSPAAFGPWLLQIVRNAAREHLKRAERSQARTIAGVELPAHAAGPAEAAAAKDFDEYLWRKVSELPEGIREAIFLYYHDGESTRSVAKALGVSRSAVKWRLREGRDLLRGRLWQEMEKCFREILPPPRDWRLKGRRLALVAMLSLGPSWAARGAEAAAAAGPVGVAGLEIGAFVMLKKIAGLAAAVLLAAITGGLLVSDPLGWRQPGGAGVKPPIVSSGPWTVASKDSKGAAGPEAGGGAIALAVPATGISGTVRLLDAGDPPAEGARIAVIAEGEARHAAVATAGADGRYAITDLLPGWYRVFAWKESWTDEGAAGRVPVEVRAGEASRIDLVLVPGIIVTGRVVEAGTGKPISGASVDIASLQFATTDGEGRYRLEGAPAMQTRISAIAAGFARKTVEIDLGPEDRPVVPIELEPGGMVEGTVIGPEGHPAPRAEVLASLLRPGADLWIRARSDAGGRYRIEGIPISERNVRLSASLAGLFHGSTELAAFPEGKSQAEVDIALERGLVFEGQVVDADGDPIPGAALWIDWWGNTPLAISDGEGRFRIEGASSSADVLTARKKGFAPASRSLRGLGETERGSIAIVLEPGHTVAGTVEDPEGNPIARAWVYVILGMAAAGRTPSTYTDPEGRFRFEDLPENLEEIGATKPGFADSRNNPVEPDGEDLRLVLEKAGQVRGVVVEKGTDEPVRAFIVKVRHGANPGREGNLGRLWGRHSTEGIQFGSEDGRFAIRELTAGIFYTITVIAEGRAEGIAENVPAWPLSEEGAPVRIELEPGRALSGKVLAAATSQPIPGVRIIHLSGDREDLVKEWYRNDSSDRTVRTSFTDETGTFTIAGLREHPGAMILDKAGFARTALPGILPGPEVQIFRLEVEAVLEGTVRKAAREPVAGAQVRVWIGDHDFQGAGTDAEGWYRIEGLPAGEARVKVYRDEAVDIERGATLIAGRTAVLDIGEADGSIVGKVTHLGKPVPSAEVSIEGAGSWETTQISTGLDGGFRVEGLPPGSYRVLAKWPRRSLPSATRIVEVGAHPVQANMQFPAGRLSGQVADCSTGRPAAAVSVLLFSLRSEHSESRAFSLAAKWGFNASARPIESSFAFEALEPGRYFLVAERKEGSLAGWLGPIDIVEGAALENLTLLVGVGGRIDLTVRDARTRAPIDGFSASLRPEGGPAILGRKLRGTRGSLALPDVPQGSSILEIDAEGFLPAAEKLRLGDEPVEWTVLLEPASWIVVRLEGREFAEEGYEIAAVALSGDDPGWTLRTLDASKPVIFRTTYDEPPAFRLAARPGRYRLRIEVARCRDAWRDPPRTSRDVDLVVPPGGEAVVEMPAP